MKIINAPKKNTGMYEFTFDDVLLLPSHSSFDFDDESLTQTNTKISRNITLSIPIISSPMSGVTESKMAIALGKKGGLGVIHHYQPFERQLSQLITVKKEHVKVGVSIGDFTSEGIAHCENLLKAGADLISLESAHADNKITLEFISKLKKRFRKIELSVGVVVTAEATEAIIKAGADSVRVGIGGGSHCTTRLVTAIGRPQLSAVLDCARIAQKYHIPLISDTGIRYPGDISKAIAFGADAVMIGGLFAGTDESPGKIINRDGKSYKMTWGNCTETSITHKQLTSVYFEAKTNVKKLAKTMKRVLKGSTDHPEYIFEEGVESTVPYKGSVDNILENLVRGTHRSMWYMGVKNLKELREKARVVIISSATYQENLPRI